MVSGMFFGLSFGLAGVGAAALGRLADLASIDYVYKLCAFLPAIGLLTAFLPDIGRTAPPNPQSEPKAAAPAPAQ
jgi:FSR family fosmidomycin resistance protein-like MFS transporter